MSAVDDARITRDGNHPDFALGETIHDSIRDYAAAAMLVEGLDPVLTEVIRLRCGQVHDCRVCQSLRTREALEAGFDEETTAKISNYEASDFDARTKAALRLVDTIILTPQSIAPGLRDELHEHFTEAEIAEICLDVVKWSEQKQLVSLKIENPPWEGTNVLFFDEQGMHQIGGPVNA